jgi:hypothetical protein
MKTPKELLWAGTFQKSITNSYIQPHRNPSTWCARCCSICSGEVRHLFRVRLHEGGARRGTRDIGVAGRKVCEPVEAIDERSTSPIRMSATENEPASHLRFASTGSGR